MAISATSLNPDGFGWIVNADSANASGTEELKAAGGAGVSHYIEYISLTSKVAITATVKASSVEIFGPVEFTTSGGQIDIRFTRPVKVAANEGIDLLADSGQISCLIYGYTK